MRLTVIRVPIRRLVSLLAVAAAAAASVAVVSSAPVAAQPGGFGDVAEGAYYSVPVSTLDEQGVFAGTECAEGFCPDDPLDRKTMAVWIVRVLDGEDPPAVTQTRFNDVDPDGFNAPFVERMAELEVTSGCGDGSGYCPNGTVTRWQMAVFLSRAYNLPEGPDPGFSDVPEDAWYGTAVAKLAASGITSGCGDGTGFCPNDDTTRGQMATFLYRAENRGEPVDPADSSDTTTTADDAAGVMAPPAELSLDPFYEKYLDLEGLPIVAAARVPDEALFQARLLIGEMLTDRRDVLATLAANNVRVAIMAAGSGITEIPELSDLYEAFPGVDWDNRTRGGGVGPTFARPVLAIAEENLLCYTTDLFPHEDITVHEAAHAVLNMGIELQSGGAAFRQRLERAYQDALDAGLWQHTYAADNADEYWAEGVQSWFDVNDPPGPIHNQINTRSELEAYDPTLAGLIREALGEVTVSSCHSAASHPHSNSRILGRVLGPDGAGVEGVVLWAWSGNADTSGTGTTQRDGTFAIVVPDGSLTLDVHANTGEDCTFVGWYGPDGFTTVPGSATRVAVDGADVSGIEIILPQQRDDLPFIEWCA